ncbi:phage tail protein [Paracoccus sp. (in: a-proteobacteria)]|uniref:phage tail protein n=1 Tax=Paracoccus sp. TaxID=267 RepID=UPI0026DFF90F|nr:phage tail protein [Paracoccus sp. (in: a-proteobacteria)]MDO5646294.1 phage tail protein [Paracoccus sp. (in: a-proteobacteria)]
MGLCRGPVDELVQIKVGDTPAWPVPDGREAEAQASGQGDVPEGHYIETCTAHGPNGNGMRQFSNGRFETVAASGINTISGSGNNRIDASNLFGGDKKEGGVSGNLRAMFGTSGQIVPAYIKEHMPGRVPDFRGVVTLYFNGLLTSLNPYPKKWEVRVRRTTAGWDGPTWQPTLATIWMRNGTVKAMNGAHIIYECLTNRDWGRGLPRSMLNESAFLAAATTLHAEGFGLCMRYTRQSELSNFIQEVLDHIGGALYPDRATGKLSLSLLRGDYDPDAIPLFTYTTGLLDLEDVETASQEDLRNEVIVKWHDPITDKERSARVQNIASQQSLGATNSTTLSYAGIPDVDLALRIAQRDLKANSNALKRFKVHLDRRAWNIHPGAVFRISVPERGIINAVLRAGKISEAGGSDGRITVEAVLDVFGLPSSSFAAVQEPEWTAPERFVAVADKRLVREVTYAELAAALDPANLKILDPTMTTIAVVAGKPAPLAQAYETRSRAEGVVPWTQGAGTFSPYVVTSEAISAYQTDIPFSFAMDVGLVAIGSPVQLGDEICRLNNILIDPVSGGGTIVLGRGCVDTIPQAHAAGAVAYVMGDGPGGDEREYMPGENIAVKVLPFTSSGLLPLAQAPTDSIRLQGRQGRPYPPGRVRVNGVLHGLVKDPVEGTVKLTWAHRNRLSQQDVLLAHEQAGTSREPGSSYRVRVYAGSAVEPVRTVEGITGTSFDYTSAMGRADGLLPGDRQVRFELDTLCEERPSLNKHIVMLTMKINN